MESKQPSLLKPEELKSIISQIKSELSNAKKPSNFREKRVRLDKSARVANLEKELHNREINTNYGKSIATILSEDKDASKAKKMMNTMLKNADLNSSAVYTAALAKLKESMTKTNPDLSALSLRTFAVLVAEDDLLSAAQTVGSAAYALYQNPQVKLFVDGLVSKGYNAIRDVLFRPATSSALLDNNVAPNNATDAVSVDHLFGCLTKEVPAVGDPSDIPRLVYTNKLFLNQTLSMNSSGSAGFVINGQGFFTDGSSSTRCFILTNTANSYNPDSSIVTGTWVPQAGPLATSVPLFRVVKFLGIEVKVVPFVSMTAAQGGYVAGVLQDQLSTSSSGSFMNENVMTFANLSQQPGFEVCSMRTTSTSRSIPSIDRTLSTWWGTDTTFGAYRIDYGSFGLIVKGADPGATLDIQISLTYTLLPDKSAVNIIRGISPPIAPYTNQFMEFLRVRYPDMMLWSQEQVLELYQKLKACPQTYNALTKIVYAPPKRVRRPVTFSQEAEIDMI